MSIFPNLPSNDAFYDLQCRMLMHAVSLINETENQTIDELLEKLNFDDEHSVEHDTAQDESSQLIQECSTAIDSCESFRNSMVALYKVTSSELLQEIANVVKKIICFDNFFMSPDVMRTINIIYYLEYFEQLAKDKQNVGLLNAIGKAELYYREQYNSGVARVTHFLIRHENRIPEKIQEEFIRIYSIIHFLNKKPDLNEIPENRILIKELTYTEIPAGSIENINSIQLKVFKTFSVNGFFLYCSLRKLEFSKFIQSLINFVSEKNYCEAIYDHENRCYINPILFLTTKYPAANSHEREVILNMIRMLLPLENKDYLNHVLLPRFLENLIKYQFEEEVIKELFAPFYKLYSDLSYGEFSWTDPIIKDVKIDPIISALCTRRSLPFIHYLVNTLNNAPWELYRLNAFYYDQQHKKRILLEVAILNQNPFNVIKYIYKNTENPYPGDFMGITALAGEEIPMFLWKIAILRCDKETVAFFAHLWWRYILYNCIGDEESVRYSYFLGFLKRCNIETIPTLMENVLYKDYVTLDTKIPPNNKTVIRIAFEETTLQDEVRILLLDKSIQDLLENKNTEQDEVRILLRDEVRILLLDKWIQDLPENKNTEGLELLKIALQNNCDLSVIKKLLDNEIYIHENESTKNDILLLAETLGAPHKIRYLLFQALSDASKQEKKDEYVLLCIYTENYEALQKMATQDPNLLLANDLPFLIYLMMHENSEAKILKMLDLDLNIQCEHPIFKTSLLQVALENQTLSIITKILDKGGDIHHVNSDGISAESMGLRHRSLEVVKKFVEKGANVNLPDHKGITPIQNALANNRQDIVEYLLAHGAELNWKDRLKTSRWSSLWEVVIKK